MNAFFYKGRDWTLEETPEGPRLVIPSPRVWPAALFMSFWLFGWVAGEVSAAREAWHLLSTAQGPAALVPAGFLLFWLCGWTVGGFFAGSIFLFSLYGREVVTLREGILRIRPETVLGLGWTWKFPVAGMTPPRLVLLGLPVGNAPGAVAGAPAASYGHIAIESAGKRWRLGLGVEERRAKDLHYALTSRFGLPREGYRSSRDSASPGPLKNQNSADKAGF